MGNARIQVVDANGYYVKSWAYSGSGAASGLVTASSARR